MESDIRGADISLHNPLHNYLQLLAHTRIQETKISFSKMAAKSMGIVAPVVEENCKICDYSNVFMGALSELRDEREYCDFLLQVGGETIYVHRVALAIRSPYFAALLKSDMKEKATGSVTLEDKDRSNYVNYEENVQAIYLTSDYFQMKWLKKRCVRFLKRHLKGTNCIQTRRFADKLSLKELYDHSHTYILNNFDMLIDNEELLLLTFEEILELIKDDQLSVKFEENAYKAAINWIKHNVKERKAHLLELMSHIRLCFVRTRFLTGYITKESLLKSNLQCNEFVIQALSYQLMPPANEAAECLSENSPKPKKIPTNRNGKFYILFAGGMDIASQTALCTNSRIVLIPDISGHSVISLNGFSYSVGGFNGKNLNTAECYNPFTKQWSCIAKVNYARTNFGICTYNDCIYVMSGCGTSFSTEVFNPSTGRCHAQTHDNTINYSACNRIALIENSFGDNGTITCTRFDRRDGRCCKLHEIPGNKVEKFELFSNDRSLYWIKNDSLARLDVRINKWVQMPSMTPKRTNYSAIMIADDIYVFGGLSAVSKGELYLNKSRCCYNVHDNKWTIRDSIETEIVDASAGVFSVFTVICYVKFLHGFKLNQQRNEFHFMAFYVVCKTDLIIIAIADICASLQKFGNLSTQSVAEHIAECRSSLLPTYGGDSFESSGNGINYSKVKEGKTLASQPNSISFNQLQLRECITCKYLHDFKATAAR
uniref:BTB domain-containing protein n=1 Tax=Glossina austeni TaxID=7395 RepID=A0A1A9UII7_GLOAU